MLSGDASIISFYYFTAESGHSSLEKGVSVTGRLSTVTVCFIPNHFPVCYGADCATRCSTERNGISGRIGMLFCLYPGRRNATAGWIERRSGQVSLRQGQDPQFFA